MIQEFRVLYTEPCPFLGSVLRECYASGTGETVRERADRAIDRVLEVLGPEGWLTVRPKLTWAEFGATERTRLDVQAEYEHWRHK